MVQALTAPTGSKQDTPDTAFAKAEPTPGTAALFTGRLSDFSEMSLDDAIYRSRKYARLVALACGETSSEAAVAWEQFDELLSARAAHQTHRPQSSFEQYCELHPDAMECRLYDA